MNVLIRQYGSKNKSYHFKDNLKNEYTFKHVTYVYNILNGDCKPFINTLVKPMEFFHAKYEDYLYNLDIHTRELKENHNVRIKETIPFYFGTPSIYIEKHGSFSL